MRGDIEALAFDVGGTVFDWQTSLCAAVEALALERGAGVDPREFAEASLEEFDIWVNDFTGLADELCQRC